MKEKKPEISVVMPFYNAEKFLDESIQSILNQTFTDFEFIIINDASTDSSDKVVQKYLDDERIVYVKNKENKGIVYNLNHGIKIAKADIIARMDGDDISMPERFEKQYKYLEKYESISIVGTFASMFDEKGTIQSMKFSTKPLEIKENSFHHGPFLHATIMCYKNILFDVGMYREKYSLCEDIDILLRIIHVGYKGVNIPEILYLYRKHSSSTDTYKFRKALTGLRLKHEIAFKYNVKNKIGNLLLTYADVILTFFPRKIRYMLVNFYKKIIKFL